MPQGDKYIRFTNYLTQEQEKGKMEVSLTFKEIENILEDDLPSSCRTHPWANNNSRSLSLGWLNAGFVITSFPDLKNKKYEVTFSYNKERADAILTGNTANTQIDHSDILKNFLRDIDCLEELSKWSNKFNLFDVLKLSRVEIRHSNMLAWLFDPNENHGMGDKTLRSLINFIILNYNPKNLDEFSMVSMDLYSFEIYREWKDIDLLIVSDVEQIAICVENKIDSAEHSDQLRKYKGIMETHYKGYNIIYLYLSPDGKLPSDDTWNIVTYTDLLTIIERETSKTKLNERVKNLIEDYIDILRREIVEDLELKRICAEIYAKHKEALDLIYEHRPDDILNISAVVKDWCIKQSESETDKIIFDESNSQKGVIRFQTSEMNLIIPDSDGSLSVWKNKHFYFFEIHVEKEKLRYSLVISKENLSEETKKKLSEFSIDLGQEKKYKTIYSWSSKKFKSTSKQTDGMPSESEIESCLGEMLKEIDSPRKIFEKAGKQKK